MPPSISTCLWYPNDDALPAAEFYVALFNAVFPPPSASADASGSGTDTRHGLSTHSKEVSKISKMNHIAHFPPAAGSAAAQAEVKTVESPSEERHETRRIMAVSFTLLGRSFTALNGAPQGVEFTEAMSIQLMCETREEAEQLTENLVNGGVTGGVTGSAILTEGKAKGQRSKGGWLRDGFGVWWQVVVVAQRGGNAAGNSGP
jgi:predicted 3-demethylubiquinone-9 3-methyltransferase (glyoxalase superfamily)